MCLIGVQWQPDDAHLRLVANRDEFHARPTAAAHWWPASDSGERAIFAGRDLSAGGTWLGCTQQGRLAAVTNVRQPNTRSGGPSRGELACRFLQSDENAQCFAEALRQRARDYAGFNLLLHDGESLVHACNVPDWHVTVLRPGIHAISNADLDTPWPKVQRLRSVLARERAEEALFAALADSEPADDEALPDTGVGIELERMLSAPFINGQHYGTRASTLVCISRQGHIHFEERAFGPNGAALGAVRERVA